MPIYRVTFTTSLLVHSPDELSSERIAYKHLRDEVNNRNSQIYKVEHIQSIDQLFREERGSLPWKEYTAYREPDITVEEILQEQG